MHSYPDDLSGMDRYATNIAITKNGWTEASNIVIASGEDFPDVLSGSVLAANSNSPIVLVSAAVSQNTSAYLKDLNCRTINILGGTGAVREWYPHRQRYFIFRRKSRSAGQGDC